MCEGEYESLKALHAVSPTLAPRPYTVGDAFRFISSKANSVSFQWGRHQREEPETYFVLCEFREVGEQPPDPIKFMTRLAELHRNSVSPTGKFGFHITTCHNWITQATDFWNDSWEVVFRKQLSHMVDLDKEASGEWPEFHRVCNLILEKVVPRLLRPLQSDGRKIRPCLIHGDLWDEKTATDMETGEPFMFDAASFYAHNEYEMGNWRGHRYKLSNKIFIKHYKRYFPVSEPG
jgi:protein-ribulosamine 3-kinase